MARLPRAIIVFICLLVFPALAAAYDWTDGFRLEKKQGDRYALMLSPYTRHFENNPQYESVWLVGVLRERSDASIAGVALFSNSFGQPSAYFFPWGKIYRNVFGNPKLYAQISAGLLYGYRGQFEDKVPLNYNGFSPGVVPAIGWEFARGYRAQIDLIGLNAAMFQLSVPIAD